MKKDIYLIVETNERDVVSVSSAATYQDAADKANELLKRHCDAILRAEDYEDMERDLLSGGDENETSCDLHLIDQTKNETNAWSNLHDVNWDAHIVHMYTDAETSLLSEHEEGNEE